MIGRRDQRFMFNNKNMKIGERKRNDYVKNSKENVHNNIKPSQKDLSQRRNNHLGLENSKFRIDNVLEREKHEDQKGEEIEMNNPEEDKNEKKMPMKFKNPMKSIYIKREIVNPGFKPLKEYLTK